LKQQNHEVEFLPYQVVTLRSFASRKVCFSFVQRFLCRHFKRIKKKWFIDLHSAFFWGL